MAELELKPRSFPPETKCLPILRFVEYILNTSTREEIVAEYMKYCRITFRLVSMARNWVFPSGRT
jgi:hypothetical protein